MTVTHRRQTPGVGSVGAGGVPAFFVTGVAAGFGVNRSITIPPVGEVQDFPLLPGNFSSTMPIEDVLAKLSEVVRPELGQYWLAAGLTAWWLGRSTRGE